MIGTASLGTAGAALAEDSKQHPPASTTGNEPGQLLENMDAVPMPAGGTPTCSQTSTESVSQESQNTKCWQSIQRPGGSLTMMFS